jgi:hypothetical protein
VRAVLNIALVFLLGSLAACKQSSKLDDVFSDLSVGVPVYESIDSFDHPADAVKGDYFSLDFVQSSNQFSAFMSKLGVAQADVLSAAGVSHVAVASKINPKYPYFFDVKAKKDSERHYHVHVDGRQPYD